MLNNTLSRLESDYPAALRTLHNAFGFDYNAPVYADRINGPFTLRQIFKRSELDPERYAIAVLVKQSKLRWHSDELRCVTLINEKAFELIPPRGKYFRTGSRLRSPIDSYCRKGDFEEDRKQADYCIIIAQLRENLSPIKEAPAVETWRRYKESPRRSEWYGWRNNSGYYKLDKSGYPVEKKQDELKHRAFKLREQRKKAAADAADFSDVMESTRKEFESFRAEIISVLSAANDEHMNAAADAVRNMSWILSDLRRAERNSTGKTWTSLDRARAEWDRIAQKIAKGRETLRAAVSPAPSEEKTA